MRAQGTTTVEIKSGYGLTVDDEARALRIAGELTDETTFLGAHVVPAEYADRRDDYVDLVTGPMLRACAPHARWVDVFCEPHVAARVRRRRGPRGPRGRPGRRSGRCACTATSSGPAPASGSPSSSARPASTTARSSSDADVDALAGAAGTTVATLLPGVEFSTRSPYPDARRLLDAGVVVALATDCNPGTCYSSSMPFVIALAVREMRPDAGRGAARGDGRAARRRCGATTSAASRPGMRADLAGARRAVLPAPGLPRGRAHRARTGAGAELTGCPHQLSALRGVVNQPLGHGVALSSGSKLDLPGPAANRRSSVTPSRRPCRPTRQAEP